VTSQILLFSAFLLFVFMSLAFAVARFRKRLDIVDTAWGLGFIVASEATIGVNTNTRSALLSVPRLLVIIWGLRLASHIYNRNRRRKDDPRYEELTRKWRGNFWVRAYFSIFLLQGALIWVISLPLAMLAGAALDTWNWGSIADAGFALWLIGFTIEVIADWQLSAYLRLTNRPKVMSAGLWRYSRHPNYFGELTVWWGIGLIGLSVPYGWIGLLGPLTLSLLIIFVSGIPPIERRRQKDPEYRAYQKITSPLIPLPPRTRS
jgi:steroid 5-alpha reductase family enzyme